MFGKRVFTCLRKQSSAANQLEMSISTDVYIYTSDMAYLNFYSDCEGTQECGAQVRLIGYKKARQRRFQLNLDLDTCLT